MSVLVLEDSRPVARKQHVCELCLGTIGVGDTYRRQRNIGDDGPYVFKGHQVCWVLSLHIARECDMWSDEWPEPSEVRDGLVAVFAAIADLSRRVGTPLMAANVLKQRSSQ